MRAALATRMNAAPPAFDPARDLSPKLASSRSDPATPDGSPRRAA